ncbi:30S ribosomal protein S3 [Candidatus Gracilibacteria bacterium]|nr:30S ribosomal protein S3 [Candidatus Gracilibacteria bacterium]
MGHKVSPLAFRIGYIKTWRSNGYYDRKSYGQNVSQDVAIRSMVMKHFKNLPIGNLFINHSGNQEVAITVYTSRTALILGNNDENVTAIKDKLAKEFIEYTFTIDVKEVKKPELSAPIVADSIARQLEKKMPYRRVIKNAIAKTLEKGGLGIKVKLGGRLNGAEIARRETFKDGSIPSQTIRADVDFAYERAETPSGTLGLKVWIYKGDVFKK